MNKYFLDANFLLDVSDVARPRHGKAFACLTKLLSGNGMLCTSSDILTTIAYFVQKQNGIERCLEVMEMIASEVEILCADNQDILKLNRLLHASGKKNDYEDALQFYLADKHGCSHLVTSDVKFCQHLRDTFTPSVIGLEEELS